MEEMIEQICKMRFGRYTVHYYLCGYFIRIDTLDVECFFGRRLPFPERKRI